MNIIDSLTSAFFSKLNRFHCPHTSQLSFENNLVGQVVEVADLEDTDETQQDA